MISTIFSFIFRNRRKAQMEIREKIKAALELEVCLEKNGHHLYKRKKVGCVLLNFNYRGDLVDEKTFSECEVDDAVAEFCQLAGIGK